MLQEGRSDTVVRRRAPNTEVWCLHAAGIAGNGDDRLAVGLDQGPNQVSPVRLPGRNDVVIGEVAPLNRPRLGWEIQLLAPDDGGTSGRARVYRVGDARPSSA